VISPSSKPGWCVTAANCDEPGTEAAAVRKGDDTKRIAGHDQFAFALSTRPRNGDLDARRRLHGIPRLVRSFADEQLR
jgi:hypothetical protein